MEAQPPDDRREVINRQLRRREEYRQDAREALEPRRDIVMRDAAAVRERLDDRGIRTILVSMGVVTLYGE